MRILAATLIAVALLLTSCQWVAPPVDERAHEFHMGAVSGCLRILVWQMGPATDETRDDYLHICELMAAEADTIRQQTLDEMGLDYLPVPRPVPAGSLL